MSEPEDAGIFPRAHEDVPGYSRRDLTFHDETFVNYKSLEESEHSHGVLQELVDAGYMDVYDDLSQAESAIQDSPIVLSKLALITTLKEGSLNAALF